MSSKINFNDLVLDLQQIILKPRQIYDLEMIMNGGFWPLQGFLDEKDYENVVEKMRLEDGALWPIPVVLDISESQSKKIKMGSDVVLTDQYCKPLAIMNISSKYKPDKKREAREVYGTTDKTHYGVRYLFDQTENIFLGGKIRKIALPIRHDFTEYRKTPAELKKWFSENGWKNIIGFQTRNPIHKSHFELMNRAAEAHNANILIQPVVGETRDGDIDALTRIRSYKKVLKYYPSSSVALNLLPLSMRMAGPREALWHAIIRKNYGCTHFIVGRDHAGPGKNAAGDPFYPKQAAADLVKMHEKELGMGIHTSQNILYVPEEKKYLSEDELKPHHTALNISGTEVRNKLRRGEDLPSWFSFPEVIEEIKKSAMLQRSPGLVIFFTGLSGSGKSTISEKLRYELIEIQDKNITLLDGDIVRTHLSNGLGFSKTDRDINIKRIGFVASEIVKHGGIAICAAISPYENSRTSVRRMVEAYGRFVEIYVSTPLEVCKKRDVKGLYKKAEKGLIKKFTGIDDPYEEPEKPELNLDTAKMDPEEAVSIIIEYLKTNNYI